MFDGLKNLFAEYFDFGKSDRNGIAVLLVLIALSLCGPYAVRWLGRGQGAGYDSEAEFLAETAPWREAIERQRQTAADEKGGRYAGSGQGDRNFEKPGAERFPFDPNTVSKNDLQRLGLSERQAETFIKYRTATKGFKKKEDVKKAYSISEALYASLAPYIQFAPLEEGSRAVSENADPSGQLFDFDPNTITKAEAMLLGLSEKQAETLIKYRTARNGFERKEDLKKVYGIGNALYAHLEPHIRLSPPDAGRKLVAGGPAAPAVELFAFDPNTMTVEQAVRLGLNEGQANAIIRYRDKSGGFGSKEDFKRLKVLDEADFRRLEAYIDLPEKGGAEVGERPQYANAADETPLPAAAKVDINSADEAEWMQLPGIGPSYASRILKYRDLLGGFVHPNQLLEVYGMDMERFKGFSDLLVNGKPETVRRININQADYMEFLKHPYIDKGVAKSLVAMREQHGAYPSIEAIKKSALVDEALYGKLEPYLTVE